jgi:CHASE1-domain containing sensor protein
MSLQFLARRQVWLRFWPIFLSLLLGIIASIAGAYYVRLSEQRNLHANFIELSESAIFDMQSALHYHLEPLEAVTAFYAASQSVERDEFYIFVQPFLASRPAIESIAWIPIVPSAERHLYESGVQESALPDVDLAHFVFTELHAGNLQPASERSSYYPIYYQEPAVIDGAGLGFDIGSDPTYQTLLATVYKSGNMSAIVEPSLTKDGALHVDLQIIAPIDTQVEPPQTMAARTSRVRGFLKLALRIDSVLINVLNQTTAGSISLRLESRTSDAAEPLLYDFAFQDGETFITKIDPLVAQTDPDVRSGFAVLETIGVADTDWRLIVKPTDNYLARHYRSYHWFMLVFGLFGTGLLSTYLYLSLCRRTTAERMVRLQTEQVTDANQRLQSRPLKLPRKAYSLYRHSASGSLSIGALLICGRSRQRLSNGVPAQ